jgi:hypothetical protein
MKLSSLFHSVKCAKDKQISKVYHKTQAHVQLWMNTDLMNLTVIQTSILAPFCGRCNNIRRFWYIHVNFLLILEIRANISSQIYLSMQFIRSKRALIFLADNADFLHPCNFTQKSKKISAWFQIEIHTNIFSHIHSTLACPLYVFLVPRSTNHLP